MTWHEPHGVTRASASPVLDLLEQLIHIESVNPGLDPRGSGESKIATFIAEWGRNSGLRSEVLEGRPGRPSVILRGGRNAGGRRLLLCGHLDTVGLGGAQDALIPRVEGDRLYGRGAYDMKAGLAAALVACRDVVAGGIDGEIVVAAVADEECGSFGIEEVLEHLDPAGFDAAVVTEPTERNVGTAHRGIVWTEVTVSGLAAHGSRPHLGADAILAAGRCLVALDVLNQSLAERAHPALGPGNLYASLITGGTEGSTVPDRCVFTVERRTVPGEELDEIERETAELLKACCAPDPRIRVSSRTVMYRPPMETPTSAPIVQALLSAAGKGTEVAAMSYWADSAILSSRGVPTVLYGPEGDGAHADIEWVSRSGTESARNALYDLASTFCR